VTAETQFQAASVSKPISAIAAMIALDDRLLTVDANIDSLFASFSGETSVGG